MIRIRSSFLLGLNKLAATKSNNSYSAPPLFGLSSTQIKPDHLSTSCRKCHYIHHVVRVDSHVNVTKAAHQSIMETMRHTSLFLLPPNLEQEHETISATSSPIPHPVSASAPSSLNYALVLLNQRIPQFTPQLWDHGTFFGRRTEFAFFFVFNCVFVGIVDQHGCGSVRMEEQIGYTTICRYCFRRKILGTLDAGSTFFAFLLLCFLFV